MFRFAAVPLQPTLTRFVAVAVCLAVLGQSSAAWAKFKPKRGIGRSNQRIGLASRGGCAVQADSRPLTAIVPLSTGLAATATPTFTWFMPDHTYPSVEFRLLAETEFGLDIVHRKVFENLPKNQLVTYDLSSADNIALEAGQAYKWQVHLVCDPDMPSGNLFAEGWVEYQPPNAILLPQVQAAAVSDKANLWLENGYWYDGVQALTQQLQTPANQSIACQQWQELMTDEAVDLPHLAQNSKPNVN